MDLDIRIVQIDADLGMVPSDVFPELAGQILTREGMGPHSPRTEGERLACREGGRRLRSDGLPQRIQIRMHFHRGTDGDHAEDAAKDGQGLLGIVHVDVNAGFIRFRDAFDALAREQILDVGDETVPQLTPHVPALEGQFSEPHEEDHEFLNRPRPIFSG